MDEKQHPNHAEKNKDTQNKLAGRPGSAKRVMAKRWLYPAIYLGAAAVIIGLMYARSQMTSTPTGATPTNGSNTSTTATQPSEPFEWPAAASVNPEVTVPFFSSKGSVKEQESALVEYDNTYYAHRGVDIKAKDGSSFQVTAALSGKVTKVENDPLNGQTVSVESDGGYTETYQSLDAVNVKQGQEIRQGDVIGTAGTNTFEKGQGNHLYFEVDLKGQPIDPESVLPAK